MMVYRIVVTVEAYSGRVGVLKEKGIPYLRFFTHMAVGAGVMRINRGISSQVTPIIESIPE
jgi:hypothetical protein